MLLIVYYLYVDIGTKLYFSPSVLFVCNCIWP